MTRVVVSWPARALQPHAKGHWRAKARATKAYRQEAAWAARATKVQPDPRAVIHVEFYPPDNRRRDLHNMPSMVKAAIDGVADAMGCDDNRFRVRWPDEFGPVVQGGCVVMTVKSETPTD